MATQARSCTAVNDACLSGSHTLQTAESKSIKRRPRPPESNERLIRRWRRWRQRRQCMRVDSSVTDSQIKSRHGDAETAASAAAAEKCGLESA